MYIRKAKISLKILKAIDFYRKKNSFELGKIRVQWACGINKEHLYNVTLCPSEGYSMFYVKLKDLIKSADFGEMGQEKLNPRRLFTGNNERDFRVAKILDHWNNSGYIDPPEICFNHLQEISFGDGRHRTIVAFHLGEKEIPVMVHKTLVKRISAVINLNKF